MEELSFVHSSDWQIGMRLTTRLDGDAQALYADARISVIAQIGRLARDHDAAFVVVAGDVYEHSRISDRELATSLEAMSDCGLDIYLLPGNHDPLSAHGIWRSSHFIERCPDNVTVLDGSPIDREDCQIVSAPWRAKNPGTDPVAAALAGLEPIDRPRILVGHGMLDSIDPDRCSLDSVSRDRLVEAIEDGLIDYVALGDRHITAGGSELDDPTGAIWYSGTPQTTSWREKTPGTALTVTLGQRTEVRRHEIGQWVHVELIRELNSAADVTALDEELATRSGKRTTIARLRLSGGLSAEQDARLSHIIDKHSHSYAALLRPPKYDELVLIPDDDTDFGLGGFAADALDELRERDDEVAREAIRLLYRLARKD